MGNTGVPRYHVVSMVLQAVLLVGSAALALGSIHGMLARRRGYRGLLVWALFIPFYLAWKTLSPGIEMSAQWHHFSYSLRTFLGGAWVMYGLFLIPFLSRDSKAWKAERKRAREQSRGTR